VVTLGWSRQLARTLTPGAPAVPFDNPFGGGSGPANAGEHGQARDQIGVGVELSWP